MENFSLGQVFRWEDLALDMQIMRGKANLMTFDSYPDVSLSLARERHADQ